MVGPAGLRCVALVVVAFACARAGPYRYFSAPDAFDPWSYPIARWQARERAEGPRSDASIPVAGVPGVAAGGAASLGARYGDFLSASRRQLVGQVAAWIQSESRARYVDDGPIDVWPSHAETLAADGDDCDGLELLVYRALLELGFPRAEVWRSILRNEESNLHHMVTLWFEVPDDPWVIDPTATITRPPRRMSELEGWIPIKVFSESAEYSVRRAVP
jgi:hypothetical protein